MQYKDYYQTLGVARDATEAEIKKAFRKQARRYHPDVSKEADAEQRMQEVNEANAVLSDPERRAAYDRLGSAHHAGEEFRPPPDWQDWQDGQRGFGAGAQGFSSADAADFSDFFSQIFGAGGFAGTGHGSGAARGEDQHARIELDLDDAFKGATRQISVRVPRVDGQGRVTLDTRTLDVKIPVGVGAGQVIRLSGQGSAGYGGGPSGDLYLEVQFRPRAPYRVDGRDLHLALPVAPWELALGATVPVDLPGGRLQVRVPEGARNGGQLRLRGKGIPGHPAGDVILTLEVVLPPADTPKAREFYTRMASELAFDPRRSTGRTGS